MNVDFANPLMVDLYLSVKNSIKGFSSYLILSKSDLDHISYILRLSPHSNHLREFTSDFYEPLLAIISQ